MAEREREVITEFIELYRDFHCLWDLNSESYKDNSQKQLAWDVLTEKLKEIDPDANTASAKKKIEHLKYSYQREAKKVKESKQQTGAAASEVHKPSLWYYELMTFLDKKNDSQRSGIDTLVDDNDELVTAPQAIKRQRQKTNSLERKKEKLLDSAQQLLEEKPKFYSFGMYVGEKLENLSPFQRQVAEKLISEVIFLAGTNNLNFDSRIETPSRVPSLPHTTIPYGTQPVSFLNTRQIRQPVVEMSIPSPPSLNTCNSKDATLSSPQFLITQSHSAPVKYKIMKSPSLRIIHPPTSSPNSNHSSSSPYSNTREPSPHTFVPSSPSPSSYSNTSKSPSIRIISPPTPSPNSNHSSSLPYSNTTEPPPHTFTPSAITSISQQHSSPNTTLPTKLYQTNSTPLASDFTQPQYSADIIDSTNNNVITEYALSDGSIHAEGPALVLKELLIFKKNT